MTFELPARFWAKTRVEDRGYDTPCLIWTAYRLGGYGRFGYKGRTHYAHRLAYEAQIGPLPPSTPGVGRPVLDHLCEIKACVNAGHLEVVTNAENLARAVRARPPRTHCGNGHALDDANRLTEVLPSGRKRWRRLACRQDRDARRRAETAARGHRPSPNQRLSEAKATEIRRRYAAGGVSQSALAAEYGVNQTLISMVVRRQIWQRAA